PVAFHCESWRAYFSSAKRYSPTIFFPSAAAHVSPLSADARSTRSSTASSGTEGGNSREQAGRRNGRVIRALEQRRRRRVLRDVFRRVEQRKVAGHRDHRPVERAPRPPFADPRLRPRALLVGDDDGRLAKWHESVGQRRAGSWDRGADPEPIRQSEI